MKESRLDTPDTGSLREDILTLMREINSTRVQLITVMNMHLADYHQETGTSPGALRDPLVTGRAEALDVLFGRAVDRGEIAPELLTERIKSLPFDLLRHEILTTFAPVPDHALEEIVDTVFLPWSALFTGREARSSRRRVLAQLLIALRRRLINFQAARCRERRLDQSPPGIGHVTARRAPKLHSPSSEVQAPQPQQHPQSPSG